MVEDYSTNPNTLQTRRCYHNKTKAQKREIFARQDEIKRAKIAAGQCRNCSNTRERKEIQLCNDCSAKMATRIKEYKINNALDGRCCKCPNPADGGSSHCKGCKEKARLAAWIKRHSPRYSAWSRYV